MIGREGRGRVHDQLLHDHLATWGKACRSHSHPWPHQPSHSRARASPPAAPPRAPGRRTRATDDLGATSDPDRAPGRLPGAGTAIQDEGGRRTRCQGCSKLGERGGGSQHEVGGRGASRGRVGAGGGPRSRSPEPLTRRRRHREAPGSARPPPDRGAVARGGPATGGEPPGGRRRAGCLCYRLRRHNPTGSGQRNVGTGYTIGTRHGWILL